MIPEAGPAADPFSRSDPGRAKKEVVRGVYRELALRAGKSSPLKRYYYRELAGLLRYHVEPGRDILDLGCGDGRVLARLDFNSALGIDFCPEMLDRARENCPSADFLPADAEELPELGRKFDHVLLVNLLGDLFSVQRVLENLRGVCRPTARLVIVYYNYLWEPLVKLAERIGVKARQPEQNWLSPADIANLLHLSGFELVDRDSALLLPLGIPGLAFLGNRLLARLPLFRRLCFVNAYIARPRGVERDPREVSCSVVVPCRNEEGNVEMVLSRVPDMGKWTEVIFVDDRSTDRTAELVAKLIRDHPGRRIKLVPGPGEGKFGAVRAGFAAAEGDLLMILDADATVPPEELPLFFRAWAGGKGDFINGCRLVYEMEEGAMRLLNILGNKLFGLAFSYLLSQRIKDTLCGTKVFSREDYRRMEKLFGRFGYDSWGDFNLLFSAARLGMKIVDLPVHYRERLSGETKMKKRFGHGWIMLKMCGRALVRFKFRC